MKPSRRPTLELVCLEDRTTPANPVLASHTPGGAAGNALSTDSVVSADGRFVAFDSDASDLVPGDTNNARDVFLFDRATGAVTLVSRTPAGTPGNGLSSAPAVSADGRYVAFQSDATDLAPGDTNGLPDVFRFDRLTGAVELVSRTPAGTPGGAGSLLSSGPSISGDGRFVAFPTSTALTPADTNGIGDVYVFDGLTGTVALVSRTPGGAAGGGLSLSPFVSANGASVVFTSSAHDLAPSPGGSRDSDVYLYDTATGVVVLVSNLPGVTPSGVNSFRTSGNPSVSADGQTVAFTSGLFTAVGRVPPPPTSDVFVFDRGTGAVAQVTTNPQTPFSPSQSVGPRLSADGKFVAFTTQNAEVLSGGSGAASEVFLYDRAAGTTTLVSRTPTGAAGGGLSSAPAVSGDGRYVAFQSDSPNLVTGDGNNDFDVFRFDRLAGAVSLVSRTPAGSSAGGRSFLPTVSADGRVVAFVSSAADLAPGDGNGTFDVFVRDLTAAAGGGPGAGPVAPAPVRLLAAGAGPGGGPVVSVFNPDGTPRSTFFAFDEGFRGGVAVATADLTGDLVDDIVVGAGPGGGPVVRVFDGNTGALLANFFAFGEGFRGGVSVAAADLDGDGVAEIIVGAGPGGGPVVRVFDRTGNLLASFLAFDESFRGGVTVAGLPGRVVVAAGAGGGPVVREFDLAGNLVAGFFAFDESFRGGVTLAAAAGRIIVGTGPGGGPVVRVFNPDGTQTASFLAFDEGFRGGVNVGAEGGPAPRLFAAPGPGGGPVVRSFGLDGPPSPQPDLLALDPNFRGGLSVG